MIAGDRESTWHEAPAEVAANPHMLKIWHRNRHILPAIAFDSRYWHTLLLPLKTERVRTDVGRLRQIILREHQPTQVRILNLAASECGFTKGRTKMLLDIRRGLEWDWSYTDKPSGRYCFFAVHNKSLKEAIPFEVSIEYLVAELERHTVEFYLPENHRLTLRWSSRLPFAEVNGWLSVSSSAIAKYIRNRDGIKSNDCPGEKLRWQPPERED
jgi:hypothetical protein